MRNTVNSRFSSTFALKSSKMNKTLKNVALAAFVALVASPVATGALKRADNAAIVRNLDIFNSLYKELNTFYVDTLNPQKSIETAINAMLDDIDPYTEYYPAKKQDDLMMISTGEYGGIGSYIMLGTDKAVYISEPYEGSPAAKAGLRPGDRIVKINGKSVKGWTQDKVSENLKGQANTSLTVTVVRPYCTDSVKTFNIVREKIKVNPVPYYGVVRGNIGYINLTTFNEQSAEAVKKALLEFKKNPQVKYLALDLRGNGGGLLESAVQIVGYFVPKGTMVLKQKGRLKQSEKIYKTTEEPIVPDMPLAVLIDGGSASSSEITAGSLQDLDRAVILGSRSFGKGLVQTTRQLPFDGLLKVTIAKYYIPSGRLIQEIDYSHRNADGTFKKVPDSLTNVFTTAHGRKVRDGGGITPDIKINYPEVNRLVYNVVRDHWAFNYATKYASTHASVPSPAKFEVTDSMFADFKRFVDPKKFNYDKVCEEGVANLKKVAKTEGYMNDSTAAVFAQLEKLLKHDLGHDLDVNRKQLSGIIADEIMKRYYYQRGQIENTLNNDEAIDKAEAMFTKPGEYKRMLNLN